MKKRPLAKNHPRLSSLDKLGQLLADAGETLETMPEAWRTLWQSPVLRAIAYLDVPARFNPYPLSMNGFDFCNYHQRLELIEYLSRFDASSLMSLPGPSLSSWAILNLGTDEQIRHFFERFQSSPDWAFFAVTEPSVGSDATAVRSCLSGVGIKQELNAEKTLIGGIRKASVGLVFARLRESQQFCLIIVEPLKNPQAIQIEDLKTFGLAGAGLGRLSIRNLAIEPEQIIGAGRGLRHGLNAIASIFERHRPMVGAMALGTAHGLLDALEDEGAPVEALLPYRLEHEVLLQRMIKMGMRYEKSLARGHELSLFKLHATRFVERVALTIPKLLRATAILSSSKIRRKYRDAFAFEYMEGTSNIHLLNAYRTYVASRGTSDVRSELETNRLGSISLS